MSKVLVIHPKDPSTEFLKLIYEDKGYDVINDADISTEELVEAIENHDKIIMLGHGTPQGLINPSYYMFGRPYLIDSSFTDLLKEKETISIWCNSDQFFKLNGIFNPDKPQLHTKMVISETVEQSFVLGKVYLNEAEQLENMIRFSKAVHKGIDGNGQELVDTILANYTGTDEVTKYNRDSMIAF